MVTWRPRRWPLTLVVGLCVLALPVAAIPTVAAAVIHCCCGKHDAARGCECKDCPANHRGEPAHRDATIKACGAAGLEVTLVSHVAIAPVVAAPVRDLEIPAIAAVLIRPRVRLPDPPPCPPPRG